MICVVESETAPTVTGTLVGRRHFGPDRHTVWPLLSVKMEVLGTSRAFSTLLVTIVTLAAMPGLTSASASVSWTVTVKLTLF